MGYLDKAVRSSAPVAFDTETTGLDIRDGRDYLTGLSIAWEDEGIYFPFRHANDQSNYDFNRFRTGLQNILSSRRIIFHNAKFDLVSLGTIGLNALDSDFVDTMVLAHLIDEEKPVSKGLDAVGKYYCDQQGKVKSVLFEKMLKTLGWRNMPGEMMVEYATWDAALTLKIYNKLVPLLQAENLGPTWEHKRKFMLLLIDMESKGVRIDANLCEIMQEDGEWEMDEIKRRLGGVNPGSSPGLKKLLVDQMGLPIIKKSAKTGNPSFDSKAMEEYDVILKRMESPIAKEILAYRGWQKAVSSYYRPYQERLSPDGRLRPSYKLHGTKTGRLSCAEPNLQQIPKETDKPWNGTLKKAFIPAEGFTLLEFDYAQLELRLGAAYANETGLLETFRLGEVDVFTQMSTDLGFTRQETKTLVYSMQYGAGLQRLMNVFGVSKSRAAEIRDRYFNTYPGFKKITSQAAAKVEAYGKIQLWSGRFRHFTYRSESYKAFNSVIQGGGADVVERTMLRLVDNGFNTADCRMLLQVHDSVVFEVKTELVEQVKPEIERIMAAVPAPFDPVTFKVEGKVWGA